MRGKVLVGRAARHEERTPDVQVTRVRRATLIVVALAAVVALCVAASQFGLLDSLGAGLSQSETGHEGSYVGRAREEALAGGDLEDILGESGLLVGDETKVPEWFAHDLFDLEGFEVVAATGDWSVAWLSTQLAPGEALDLVAERMSTSGWTGYESGAENQATFVREEGSCRWAMASCFQVGGSTDVVMRIWRTSTS